MLEILALESKENCYQIIDRIEPRIYQEMNVISRKV